MSAQQSFRDVVRERFVREFGPPHRTHDKDSHWSLRSLSYIAAVNVLINGSGEWPVVWVFDPHDPKDGVLNVFLKSEADIDEIVAAIKDRVTHAGRPPKH